MFLSAQNSGEFWKITLFTRSGIFIWRNSFIVKELSVPFIHSHKKRKDVWKHGWYCWYFRFNLKYLGWPYRAYIETAKNCDFWEEWPSENDFEVVLATFCCYEHGAMASEVVQKIATDQKEYPICSSCVIICWIAKIYLSINKSEKWLVTMIPST